ncbi:MAG: benzoyl-CoA-dihydrodiol lyase [Acidimicrobiaceae bacterium]|jgi:benzoyl-CoA-dihydrodiol lyase|nr:benzoyl-CoA-dihydrodiol lyase [Acidimicrobiaceae bacterium]MBT5580868.1 benzoyl-CoA-dihydrodiol lyase [Acidimicrobiaceae bacterium]
MNEPSIDFSTAPDRYRHWRLNVQGSAATLTMAVDPDSGLRDDYQLKTNSYDLGVDIELNDAVQRLRFEHPAVRVVVVTGGLDKIFCAGANIQMLAGASHGHKVNFCKFTNETRNGIEDATTNSRQTWIAALNGTAAGGGYELALACDEILLIDDKSSAVSLPEIPLLAVLPGTGGLTRVVEKRHVRRDLADVFATRTEGIRGKTAIQWGLVDHIAPASTWDHLIAERTTARAAESDRPSEAVGIELRPLDRTITDESITYTNLTVSIDRSVGSATFTIHAPEGPEPTTGHGLTTAGADAWLLRTARELDDAILHLRFNETHLGTWVFRTEGDSDAVSQAEAVLGADAEHWAVREIRLFWARTLERLDVSARSLVTVIDPGSCFVGTLAELVLVADRSFMLEGSWEDLDDPPSPPTIRLTHANLGWYPMPNDLTRLRTRFWGREAAYTKATLAVGKNLLAAEATDAELVTFTPDDLDWEDELRITLEERNSFSPDALTGMEANYRFVGPETMKTKIFSRLSAWQNWIFQRPNAVGPDGALKRFGTGSRPDFDQNRV